MKKDFNIVTTFDYNRHEFGREMVFSARKYLPSNCTISVYLDNPPNSSLENLKYFQLPTEKIKEFQKVSEIKKYTKMPAIYADSSCDYYNDHKLYLWDAGRFCYKIYAMHEATKSPERYTVWVDADVLFHDYPSEQWMHSLVKEGAYTSYLHRMKSKLHSETGFIVFDTEHKYHKEWWEGIMDLYDNHNIFKFKSGWTDSHAHDHMIKVSEKKGIDHVKLSDNAWKAWDSSPLIQYCRHFKGRRQPGTFAEYK